MLKITIQAKTTKELHEHIKDLYVTTFPVPATTEKTPPPVQENSQVPQDKPIPKTVGGANKETMHAKLKAVMDKKFEDETINGVKAATEIIFNVAGVRKVNLIPEDKYQAVITRCEEVLAL